MVVSSTRSETRHSTKFIGQTGKLRARHHSRSIKLTKATYLNRARVRPPLSERRHVVLDHGRLRVREICLTRADRRDVTMSEMDKRIRDPKIRTFGHGALGKYRAGFLYIGSTHRITASTHASQGQPESKSSNYFAAIKNESRRQEKSRRN